MSPFFFRKWYSVQPHYTGSYHTPERGSKIVAVLVAVAVAVENQKRQNRDRDLKPRFKPRNRGRNIFLVSEFFSTLRVSRFAVAVAVAVLNLTNIRSLDSVNMFLVIFHGDRYILLLKFDIPRQLLNIMVIF